MSRSVSQTRKSFAMSVLAILIFSTVIRFWRLSTPTTYYFDEVYHAMTSKLVGRGDPRAFEWWNDAPEKDTAVDWLHPPLAKYTQGFAMRIFGENSFGWRVSSAVFGVLVIAATGMLAQVAFRNRLLTILAMGFAALDGLLLAQSRIAMNDIHVTFALLCTSALYLHYRQVVDKQKLKFSQTIPYLLGIGVAAGLSMGTKWSGLFILGPIGIAEGLYLLRRRWSTPRLRAKSYAIRALTLLVIPFCIYVLSYAQMFLQGKSLVCVGTQVEQGSCYCSQESSPWVDALSAIVPSQRPYFESLEARGGCKRLISHFSELQHQIWWYQTNLKATHPYQSRPWQWALDLRPVWTSVTYDSPTGEVSNIYTAGNPILFWGGLVAAITLSAVWLYSVYQTQSASLELGFLLALYWIVWAPWTLSPRIMFFYHYTPAVPLLAILSAYLLTHLPIADKHRRVVIGIFCLAMVIAFGLLFPIFTGYPMKQAYFDAVFSVFPSWK